MDVKDLIQCACYSETRSETYSSTGHSFRLLSRASRPRYVCYLECLAWKGSPRTVFSDSLLPVDPPRSTSRIARHHWQPNSFRDTLGHPSTSWRTLILRSVKLSLEMREGQKAERVGRQCTHTKVVGQQWKRRHSVRACPELCHLINQSFATGKPGDDGTTCA